MFRSLQYLKLSQNAIKKLPSNFGELSKLINMDLSGELLTNRHMFCNMSCRPVFRSFKGLKARTRDKGLSSFMPRRVKGNTLMSRHSKIMEQACIVPCFMFIYTLLQFILVRRIFLDWTESPQTEYGDVLYTLPLVNIIRNITLVNT